MGSISPDHKTAPDEERHVPNGFDNAADISRPAKNEIGEQIWPLYNSRLYTNLTTIFSPSTGVSTIDSFVVPLDTLNLPGEQIVVEAWGALAAAAGLKQVSIDWNGVELIKNILVNNPANKVWYIKAVLTVDDTEDLTKHLRTSGFVTIENSVLDTKNIPAGAIDYLAARTVAIKANTVNIGDVAMLGWKVNKRVMFPKI